MKRPHAAAEFHHAYLAALRSQTEPAHTLAGVLTKKLREQGIDGSKHFDAIKRAAEQLLAAPSIAEQIHPNTDSIIWSRVLGGLSSKVELQFVKVQRRIELEERQIRKEKHE